jgi:hypothetical protein
MIPLVERWFCRDSMKLANRQRALLRLPLFFFRDRKLCSSSHWFAVNTFTVTASNIAFSCTRRYVYLGKAIAVPHWTGNSLLSNN